MKKGQSRYQPLLDHLAACTEEKIALTFPEIEALIGGALPETATYAANWWTAKQFSQVVRWRALGWKAHTELRHGRVRFTREAHA